MSTSYNPTTVMLNFTQEKHINTSSLPIPSMVWRETTLYVKTRMEDKFCQATNNLNLYLLIWRGSETIVDLEEEEYILHAKKAAL
jgi:hypothetical protein